MDKDKINIVSVTYFRSKSLVNSNDDMVRVTLDLPVKNWYKLKTDLKIKE